MKGHSIKIVILLLIVTSALCARFLLLDQYLNIHHIREHKEQLLIFIRNHYIEAVLSYICFYICTALFLPGALALAVAGGLFFGIFPTVIYANIGATGGAVLAFAVGRFVLGDWIQERFKERLRQFNKEISQHGQNYLLVMRILPIAPFFVVNYCAGITKIPLKTFVWTTALGMVPGSLIYAFIGEQLREVNVPADLFSWKIMLASLLFSLFALLPVVLHHLSAARK